jgi:BirA family biotin operon repressor/biotin-[acetyl-CoA-carboxylase] ligase
MTKEFADSSPAAFTKADLRRVQIETFVQQIEFHRELTSTNDLALQMANQDGLSYPLLVLAEIQTAGRGRRENRWWAAGGALTFSLLLETDSPLQADGSEAGQLPPHRWPLVSMTAGLAICEALEELLPKVKIQLKWPNDVYIQGRKVCGILVETPRLRSGKLVLGVGLNVNNSITSATEEVSKTASALCDVSGSPFPLADVLVGLLNKLKERLDWIGVRDQELRDRWRKRCLLTNRRVQVDTDNSQLVGLCQGIDDEGALLLDTKEGRKQCFAGSITLLEV